MSIPLPRLSSITEVLAEPEKRFEAVIRDALGLEVPPGPASVIASIQKQFETSAKPPTRAFRLPEMPRLPKIEDILSGLPTIEALPPAEEVAPAPGTARILRG